MSTLTTRRNIVFSIALLVLLGTALYGFLQHPGMIPRDKNEIPEKDLVQTAEVAIPQELRNTYEQRIAVSEAAYAAREDAGQYDELLAFAIGSDADIIGDLAKARKYYEAYFQVNPVNFTVMLDYARVLANMGDLERAGETYRHLIEIVPTEQHLNRYARFLENNYQDGSHDKELRELYEAALDHLGQQEWILLGLGQWYERNDDCKAAIDHYEVALQLNPENEHTQEDLADLRATCR